MRILCAVLLSAVLSTTTAQAIPISPLSVTDAGLTLHAVGSPLPDGFAISDAIGFTHLHHNTLIELFTIYDDLIVTFSQPVSAIKLDFALSVSAPADLEYTTYAGGTVMQTGDSWGLPPVPFTFTEGMMQFTSPAFDTIVFHSPIASAFALDNLIVTTARPRARHRFTFDAPEPLSLAVFGAGLAGVAGGHRRRKGVVRVA